MPYCKYCGKEYKLHGIHNHERFCDKNPNKEPNEYLKQNAIKTCKILADRKLKEKANIVKTEHFFICPKCGKRFSLFLTDKEYKSRNYRKYCSRSCANARIHSEETKLKISDNVKFTFREIESLNPGCSCRKIPYKIYKCKTCGKTYTYKDYKNQSYCSAECKNSKIHDEERRKQLSEYGRKGGIRSATVQAEIRRSKNEICFCNLCEKFFENVEHNIPIFNNWDADIIIHDIKFAVLWNGPWHYRKIKNNHSVKQVQNRDNIKIREIEKFGYTPYIIKDDGKYNEVFVKEEFNKFISYLKDKELIN